MKLKQQRDAVGVAENGVVSADEVPPGKRGPESDQSWVVRLRQALSIRNISAIYVFAALFLIYSIWVPDTFLTSTTWKSLLDEQAVTGIVAVGLVLPLAAGAFDLSIGYVVGIGSFGLAWLMAEHGLSAPVAILAVIVGGALIGLINGFLVTRVRIDSFIATLAVGSILAGLTTAMSNGTQIIGLDPGLTKIANSHLFGITLPVYYLLAIGIVLWWVLDRTPIGRHIYATGGNAETARLAGVSTGRIVAGCLAGSAAIAAIAGVLVTARIGSANPEVGPEYLLPAFTAAFLGSTQLRHGRFNVWGTIIAVYVLAVGVKGLQLGGAPFWIAPVFNGVALILAVGPAKYQRRKTIEGNEGPNAYTLVRRLLHRKADADAPTTGGPDSGSSSKV
jgi:ribose transport system permease protein